MARRLRVFHAIVVVCAAATVIFSWPLWQSRIDPPLLALMALPAFSTGFPLLAALAFALVRPAAGLVVYAPVLAYAIASDWTRLQPAMISFGFLMAAVSPGPRGGGDRADASAVALTLCGAAQVAEPRVHGVSRRRLDPARSLCAAAAVAGRHCSPWLDVPEPGEHAFVRAYFARTCVTGDRLVIRERRWFFLATGREWTRVECGPDR